MADITAQMVNDFRKTTGLGLMECKNLLKEAEGDVEKAAELAKAKHGKNAENRAGRAANAGRIEVYIHHDGKQGAMVEVVANRFRRPQRRISPALQGHRRPHPRTNPKFIRREDMPADALEAQKTSGPRRRSRQ